jgi:hypothetical protein
VESHVADWSAGRDYARVYQVQGKGDVHAFLQDAVARSGGRVLFASEPKRAPIFLGIHGTQDERIGLLVYPFRMTRVVTKGRPTDEVRGQIRYGSEPSWRQPHPIGRDITGVDITLAIGAYLEGEVIVGLDPALYDPLPMGISIYAKDKEIEDARASSWHVWERANLAGSQRREPRARDGLETLVAFTPDRLLDYARLERHATDLGLDPALRFAAAQAAGRRRAAGTIGGLHVLEAEFELTSAEILEIIATRNRLSVAVRGGVAEHHLERVLRRDPTVATVTRLDQDAQPDFAVTLTDQRRVLVECKNASPKPYADGAFKVEVQKTRSSKGDPASRFYRVDQFDVVAACLYAPTHAWDFRYRVTAALTPHPTHPGRIAPIQRIDDTWHRTLRAALG